jgi:hypothetical protein
LRDKDRELHEDLGEDDDGRTVERERLMFGEEGSTFERGRDFGHPEQDVVEQDEEEAASASTRGKERQRKSRRQGKVREPTILLE